MHLVSHARGFLTVERYCRIGSGHRGVVEALASLYAGGNTMDHRHSREPYCQYRLMVAAAKVLNTPVLLPEAQPASQARRTGLGASST
jgi:hypothetical protein